MANADRPTGFRPYGPVRMRKKFVAGAAVYPGDMVKLSADGKVDPVSAGNDIFGCALSYASGDGEDVLLSIHPDQLYIGQADGSDIDAQTDIGNLFDVLATAGNSTYKQSRQEVDSSTASTSDGQLALLDVVSKPGNAFGEFAEVVVKINEHQIMGENDSAGI